MKHLILISIFSLSFFAAKAQNIKTNPRDTTVYSRVEVQPEYTGGFKAITAYLKANTKNGSDKGMVITTFVVEKDGSITHIHVVRSLSPTADKEAVRLISGFPRFIPAKKDGKVVRCSFAMPIKFP